MTGHPAPGRSPCSSTQIVRCFRRLSARPSRRRSPGPARVFVPSSPPWAWRSTRRPTPCSCSTTNVSVISTERRRLMTYSLRSSASRTAGGTVGDLGLNVGVVDLAATSVADQVRRLGCDAVLARGGQRCRRRHDLGAQRHLRELRHRERGHRGQRQDGALRETRRPDVHRQRTELCADVRRRPLDADVRRQAGRHLLLRRPLRRPDAESGRRTRLVRPRIRDRQTRRGSRLDRWPTRRLRHP